MASHLMRLPMRVLGRPRRSSPSQKDQEQDIPESISGIREVTENIEHPRATIIFIHGLGGHPVKTWEIPSAQSDTFWPKAWLPQEPGMESIRICTFGYENTLSPKASVCDIAKALLQGLLTSKLLDTPIIFLSHCIGGLVVKRAYMLAVHDPMYVEVAKVISQGAMVFLGTPHRGFDNIAAVQTVLSIKIRSKKLRDELKAKSFGISYINENFRQRANDLTLWSLYESRATKRTGLGRGVMLVHREFGVMGYPNEGSAGLDGDHRSICRFGSRTNSVYATITNLLTHIIETKISKTGEPFLNLDRQPSLDLQQPAHLNETRIEPPTANKRRRFETKRLREILGELDANEETLLSFQGRRISEESCQWIFDKTFFKWWADSALVKPGRYLWLSGPPGAGKSVLASAIVDKFRAQNRPTAFYFFQRDNVYGRSTRALLLSLAAQMAMFSPDFAQRLIEIDAHEAAIKSMPTRVLWQRLMIEILFMLKDPVVDKLCWVIDGLDEAETPSEVIDLIGKIDSQTAIHVLFTSRVSLCLNRSFELIVPHQALQQGQIEAADTQADMAAYARLRLDSLPFEPEDVDEIVDLVVYKSQGIFLWVRYAVEEILATAHTINDVYDALEAVVGKISPVLQQILDEMALMRDKNKKIAKAILDHVVCAERPMKATALQAALQPAFGHLASVNYTITHVCPQLIRLDESSGLVQLIHESSRDFLLQCKNSEFHVGSPHTLQHLRQKRRAADNDDVFLCLMRSGGHRPR
ncbi:hypothetical protein LMH87_009920 [Akanthomyces muscarius]|uniref:NACHT domain-containing protein n=1 Tax=Akanthomyces muscarius TaxID=2231603 RepID=A0A9W8QEZ7_AKAMU|nr:hypothetical protein LMH87_009920 [Akanthomyces muscarius]KAJ4153434.1 hypothetical protein LMH87_009920 [Akanthomyces muscarius]